MHCFFVFNTSTKKCSVKATSILLSKLTYDNNTEQKQSDNDQFLCLKIKVFAHDLIITIIVIIISQL